MKSCYGRMTAASFAASFALAAGLTCGHPADAARFKTLYAFGGTPDAANPFGGVVADGSGNLFGMSEFGGSGSGGACSEYGCGSFFELSHSGRKWAENVLYSFTGTAGDGYSPPGAPLLINGVNRMLRKPRNRPRSRRSAGTPDGASMSAIC